MYNTILIWESYQNLSPIAQAAYVSKFCLFSLATLEIATCSDTAELALIEQEHLDSWRWAVISPDGFISDSGSEPSRALANTAVELALRFEGAFFAAAPNG
jgi:hypothetical protein